MQGFCHPGGSRAGGSSDVLPSSCVLARLTLLVVPQVYQLAWIAAVILYLLCSVMALSIGASVTSMIGSSTAVCGCTLHPDRR